MHKFVRVLDNPRGEGSLNQKNLCGGGMFSGLIMLMQIRQQYVSISQSNLPPPPLEEYTDKTESWSEFSQRLLVVASKITSQHHHAGNMEMCWRLKASEISESYIIILQIIAKGAKRKGWVTGVILVYRKFRAPVLPTLHASSPLRVVPPSPAPFHLTVGFRVQ